VGRERLGGDDAQAVAVSGDRWAWLVLAGSRRERPGKGATEVVGRDELWVAVPGEWWVLCGYADAHRSLVGYEVHAAAPFEAPGRRTRSCGSTSTWTSRSPGTRLALHDEAQFHDHASTMGYPDHVVRGAWSGISSIAPRYTTGDWPFDGSMQAWLDGA
jgi:hypothetical protein